jgi:hypothetical protein
MLTVEVSYARVAVVASIGQSDRRLSLVPVSDITVPIGLQGDTVRTATCA